jgi:hypothetical protein
MPKWESGQYRKYGTDLTIAIFLASRLIFPTIPANDQPARTQILENTLMAKCVHSAAREAWREKERWFELCEQAATEQDSEKLLALIREITALLEEKDQGLKNTSMELRRAT